jgi:ABC-type branched-subunit amino acid transport system substrate-binding protein
LAVACTAKSIPVEQVQLQKTESSSISRNIPEEYELALALYHKKDYNQALKLFGQYYENNKSADYAADALYYMGQIFFELKKFPAAANKFQTLLDTHPRSTYTESVLLRLGECLMNSGTPDALDRAYQAFARLNNQSRDEGVRTGCILSMCEVLRQKKTPEKALPLLEALLTKSQDPATCQRGRDQIKQSIAGLPSSSLQPLTASTDLPYSAGYASLRLARLALDQNEIPTAEKILQPLATKWPKDSPMFPEIQALQQLLNQRSAVKKWRIGCILPLSGDRKIFGEKALRGIQLAMGFYEGQNTRAGKPELIIVDSENDKDTSAAAVAQLYEQGVMAIIGPLLSNTAEAAAQKAQELGVSILTLTLKENIEDYGNFVFRNFMTNSMQTDAVARYAIEELGLSRFAILYPEDNYGTTLMNLFWNSIDRYQAEVVAVEPYHPDQTDFQEIIKKLVGLYYPDSTRETREIDEFARSLEQQEPRQPSNEREADSLGNRHMEGMEQEPIIDFDAIFIPDYLPNIGYIASQLAYYDVDDVILLGANGWNNPQLLEVAKNYVQNAIFVDSFLPNKPDLQIQNFVHTYQAFYQEAPGPLEAYAYDTTRIILDIMAKENVLSRETFRDELVKVSNYPGVTGLTSFTNSGRLEKELTLLTIEKNNIVPLE